ncbi:isocitrate lyase/phosphoenolpyruvate mutase family protein [Agromyces sp. SYSU K20354]|uniref:isocitrate lyase/PEP mutase family protein n=1 Tax=Agromyces cavernae TaxID=2898659 RepID=UPI001E4CDAF1|nr:isocitrate lyase/phosphoenolpyruvate mutase family protein [Agromyces cavernae]MCD2441891.1 isocitrate lyase/phosphoenolpyruvate mutase family protein [Agromyces cavernae]
MLTPAEFRALHRPGAPLVLPNAWDLASARWLAAAGHDVVGTTSLGVAVTAGKRDGVGDIADETFELARRIAGTGIAVTVDLEAGFSDDPDEVGRYAAALADLGVVGVNIEDSDASCRLVDVEHAAAKVAAIAASAPGLYVNARTDPFWLDGDDDEPARHAAAVARGRRYLAAGATGVFVPGTLSLSTVAALVRDIPAPLNVLAQPSITVAELAGLRVARVSTGSLLFRVALGAIADAAHAIAHGGFVVPAGTPGYAETAALD